MTKQLCENLHEKLSIFKPTLKQRLRGKGQMKQSRNKNIKTNFPTYVDVLTCSKRDKLCSTYSKRENLLEFRTFLDVDIILNIESEQDILNDIIPSIVLMFNRLIFVIYLGCILNVLDKILNVFMMLSSWVIGMKKCPMLIVAHILSMITSLKNMFFHIWCWLLNLQCFLLHTK